MSPRRESAYQFFISLLLLIASSTSIAAPTPNGSNFMDANKSNIDYTQSKVDEPRRTCRSLVGLSNTNNSILSATLKRADSEKPEMCVVHGVISPEVQYIVYLPTQWNARLYMHGNGGYAGESMDDEIGHLAKLRAVQHGFAAGFTNTGHDAASEPGAQWGYDNLQKEIDFGFRAVHVTVNALKSLALEYYGTGPDYSYFDGCSTGGLQGFNEAQRFPDDFDGILAGAPVFSLNEMIWQYWKNQKAIDETPLSRQKLALLGEFILNSFDAVDGAKDGVIGNPQAMEFVPERDLPRESPKSRGFTVEEIQLLAQIYAPTYVGDKKIYPRMVIGSEFPGRNYLEGTYIPAGRHSPWEGRVVPDEQGRINQRLILESWFRYLAFAVDDHDRDWRALDPVRDMARTEQSRRIFNATQADLKSFRRRGGKMIIYHGWADFGVNPMRTIEYFEEVAKVAENEIDEFLQLYLIPGMHHCSGGVNIDRFDLLTPLINWVEGNVVPHDLVGFRMEKGQVTRTRPLCAYPEASHYRGSGSVDEHENFECVNPD